MMVYNGGSNYKPSQERPLESSYQQLGKRRAFMMGGHHHDELQGGHHALLTPAKSKSQLLTPQMAHD